MPGTFLYKADPVRGQRWARIFAERAPDLDFRIWPDVGDPAAVRFLVAWEPPEDIQACFPNLEVLFSAGAGVDQFDLDALPAHLPLVRLVEPGITHGMVEYTAFGVLALHRDMHEYRRQQQREEWTPILVRLASQRRVGVLGLGALGQAVVAKLRGFGFDCAGWSQSRRELPGVSCFAGREELPPFLRRTDILVCLLPLTPGTRGILDRSLFEQLPAGAGLVHVGRGPQLVQDDFLAALASGRLGNAVVDVTDPEPLPAGHPFWKHPQIWLTPHIASMTQPDSAAQVVLDNLRRHADGLPLEGLVDRARGY